MKNGEEEVNKGKGDTGDEGGNVLLEPTGAARRSESTNTVRGNAIARITLLKIILETYIAKKIMWASSPVPLAKDNYHLCTLPARQTSGD